MNSYSYSPTAHEAQSMQWQIQAPRIWGRIWGGLSPLLCRVKNGLEMCIHSECLLLHYNMSRGQTAVVRGGHGHWPSLSMWSICSLSEHKWFWATGQQWTQTIRRGEGRRRSPCVSLWCHVTQRQHSGQIQGGLKQSKLDNFCHMFVYCQPIFIIFGTRWNC